jgi:hypothetical protein
MCGHCEPRVLLSQDSSGVWQSQNLPAAGGSVSPVILHDGVLPFNARCLVLRVDMLLGRIYSGFYRNLRPEDAEIRTFVPKAELPRWPAE